MIRESASGKQIGIILAALVVLCSSTLACGSSTSTPAVIVSTKIVQVKVTGTPKLITSTPPPTPTPTIPPTYPGWITYTTADGLADNLVFFVIAASNGTLWCISPEGLSRFDRETWTAYSLDEHVYLLRQPGTYAASNDSLWIANGLTGIEGILRFDGETWTNYTTDDSLVDNTAYVVTVAPDGIVWIGTASGVSRFDGETWTTFTTEEGLIDNIVHFIAVAPNGLIFALTDKGISYFDGKSWATYLELEASGWKGPFVIDYGGALWFTGSESVYRLDGKGLTTYTKQDGVPGTVVTAIAIGADGTIWIGTNDGAAHFDGETWTTYTTADGLSGNYVTSIAVTPDGAVWFGSLDAGLSRYKP